jgi:acetyltransferase-like isoleucine patch superfamily enzyme
LAIRRSRIGIYIHPTAEVSAKARIGSGTLIWHQAQVREGARIGINCVLGKGVYIDFGVTIGNNCKLQNGVFIYHPAVVEDGVYLGPGAILINDKIPRAINPNGTLKADMDWMPELVIVRAGASVGACGVILPNVTVGRWAMVGAGSVVTRNVPDHGLVVGNPARLVGYVCRCNRRLTKIEGGWKCPECSQKYEF